MSFVVVLFHAVLSTLAASWFDLHLSDSSIRSWSPRPSSNAVAKYSALYTLDYIVIAVRASLLTLVLLVFTSASASFARVQSCTCPSGSHNWASFDAPAALTRVQRHLLLLCSSIPINTLTTKGLCSTGPTPQPYRRMLWQASRNFRVGFLPGLLRSHNRRCLTPTSIRTDLIDRSRWTLYRDQYKLGRTLPASCTLIRRSRSAAHTSARAPPSNTHRSAFGMVSCKVVVCTVLACVLLGAGAAGGSALPRTGTTRAVPPPFPVSWPMRVNVHSLPPTTLRLRERPGQHLQHVDIALCSFPRT